MRIWGRVFGTLFGFLVGRIIGAVLGFFVGWKFDKGLGGDFAAFNQQNETERQNQFFYITFSVMGHIAKASGQVSEDEIAFATGHMNRWGLSGETRKAAQNAFREGKQPHFNLQEQMKKLKQVCFGRKDLLQMFVEIQIQAAFADDDLHPKEREILHGIGGALGIPARHLDFMLDRIIAGEHFHQQGSQQSPQQQQQRLNDAYKILGVTPQTPARDIKKAYRKLMAQHHPDKLVAKGLPPQLMEDAKQKAQDIQAAYELVTKQAA
ncbi:co-chaperone DjlA [Thalassotalea sp. PS06]|uniref:co-chaperone DjlA n=1 Tax=Thalassotalea sp. PS06 TaxID=2594005 RepID=UPI0011642FDB|nr:co-chaperone DjlA [Thalassotalea sp. PS06]QDP02219.1 co-chaperone DjlA [Thalassotalea sp. PS06]